MLYELDPLADDRWPALVESHPESSVFHTRGWLAVLAQTYGFHPVALTTSAPQEPLRAGLVFCRVPGWFGGPRLVSLPFSDHCQPLAGGDREFWRLACGLCEKRERGEANVVEIRPLAVPSAPAGPIARGAAYWLHRLDLRPSLDEIFRRLHKDCVQRPIRRAGRDKLEFAAGRSEDLLRPFYRLVVLTRRRQKLPPQPAAWFSNLARAMGDALTIRVAFVEGCPAAAILTLRHKTTLTYKYGCSDRRLAPHGGMQALFWQAVQDAKRDGLSEFDLGRTDTGNSGLVAFKDRLGARRTMLQYLLCPAGRSVAPGRGIAARLAGPLIAAVPDRILAAAGDLFYRRFA